MTVGRAPEPHNDEWLARSSMHTQYGGLARALFERLFGPIHYPAQSAETIRALSREGVIVYVTRTRSTLLALYFNHALSRLRLPLASFVGGINLLLWQPVNRLLKLWQQRRRTQEGPWRDRFADRAPTRSEALLADVTIRGEAALIFLRPQRTVGKRRKESPNDYVRALVAAQRFSARPIFLVPHILTERGLSGRGGRGLADRLFGDSRRPGRLRLFVMFLSSLRRATVRVGDAINLQEIIDEDPETDDEKLARRVGHDLNRRMNEEERVVAGPELPEPKIVARHVLRTPSLRAVLEAEADQAKTTVDALERRATRHVKEVAARYDVRTIRLLSLILGNVFNRIYDGIIVDETGLERVLAAARRGPIVYCPSHRSHIDYLVLSYVLWEHGVTPPHIAAGANLSFFPLGTIFRSAGAFFLRRSFRDDALYAATFRAYVHELLRIGTAIEFFPEGTRSRTGKHLMPRFGMFSMLVDAWRDGARDDVLFVPVSIDYERIIEASAYQRELAGEKKQAEDVRGLLKTTRVLRSRYGRVHLQFADPISLAEIAERAGIDRERPGDEEGWRREVERLGYRVMHQMSRVASVTPTAVVATALLGHGGRAMAQKIFLERCESIVEFLDAAAARLSDSLQLESGRETALLEAVGRLVDEGMVAVDRAGRSDVEPIYRVPETRRIVVDIYKNGVMNYFAPAAIAARVLRAHQDGAAPWERLQKDAVFLSRLFKREFIYPVDAAFDSHFDDAVASLAVRGVLDVHEDRRIDVREPQTIDWLAGLLDSFVEAYWITTQTLSDLRAFPLWERELQARALERCRRAFLEGTIRRPEAANQTLVKTALGWHRQAGVLLSEASGKKTTLRLAPDYAESGLTELIDDIGRFL